MVEHNVHPDLAHRAYFEKQCGDYRKHGRTTSRDILDISPVATMSLHTSNVDNAMAGLSCIDRLHFHIRN